MCVWGGGGGVGGLSHHSGLSCQHVFHQNDWDLFMCCCNDTGGGMDAKMRISTESCLW